MGPSESTCRFEQLDDYCAVTLHRGLAEAQWADIEQTGETIVGRLGAAASPRVAVDLTELSYMGSAMVALIVRIWKTVNDKKGQMAVIAPDQQVREVIELAGLAEKWTVVDDRQDALVELGVRPAEDSQSLVPTVVALAALLGAAFGLFLLFVPVGLIGDLRIKLAVLFGSAMVGLIVGAAVCVTRGGRQRAAGIFVVVASAAVIVAGVARLPAVIEKDKQQPVENAP